MTEHDNQGADFVEANRPTLDRLYANAISSIDTTDNPLKLEFGGFDADSLQSSFGLVEPAEMRFSLGLHGIDALVATREANDQRIELALIYIREFNAIAAKLRALDLMERVPTDDMPSPAELYQSMQPTLITFSRGRVIHEDSYTMITHIGLSGMPAVERASMVQIVHEQNAAQSITLFALDDRIVSAITQETVEGVTLTQPSVPVLRELEQRIA